MGYVDELLPAIETLLTTEDYSTVILTVVDNEKMPATTLLATYKMVYDAVSLCDANCPPAFHTLFTRLCWVEKAREFKKLSEL